MPICYRCGETFEAKRSDAKYCSGRCRVAAHREDGDGLDVLNPLPNDGTEYVYRFGTVAVNPLERFWSEGLRTPDELERRLRLDAGLGFTGDIKRQAYAAGLRGRNRKEWFWREACAMYVAAWLAQRSDPIETCEGYRPTRPAADESTSGTDE